MEKEKEGFPITSLREINTLLKAQHTNIVTVRVGRKLSGQWNLLQRRLAFLLKELALSLIHI